MKHPTTCTGLSPVRGLCAADWQRLVHSTGERHLSHSIDPAVVGYLLIQLVHFLSPLQTHSRFGKPQALAGKVPSAFRLELTWM